MLRKIWQRWQGEDSLHAMAYEDPIMRRKPLVDRGRLLRKRIRSADLTEMKSLKKRNWFGYRPSRPSDVDSSNLTREQAERIHESLFPLANYLANDPPHGVSRLSTD